MPGYAALPPTQPMRFVYTATVCSVPRQCVATQYSHFALFARWPS